MRWQDVVADWLCRAGLRIVRVERIGGGFALCGARLTEVVCKTVARALKGVPRSIARLLVSALESVLRGEGMRCGSGVSAAVEAYGE